MAFSMFIFGESLERALEAIPEECQLKYYRIIKDYGLHGIEPDLTGFELATWVQMKAMIDNTMPKRNNASPVSKAGAPYGNKNAQKTIKKTIKNNSDNQNNSDKYDELLCQNNYENNQNNQSEMLNGNGNVNVYENGNGNGEKPPPLFLIKNKIKEQGFFLDDDRALERLIAGTDPPWFEGRHSYIDFIAETLREGYGDKPDRERHKVFRKLLFDAPNLREEYPGWRQRQENDGALRAAKEAAEAARGNRPENCGNCGEKLRLYGGSLWCDSCRASYTFDQLTQKWDYRGPPPPSLSEGLRNQKRGGGAQA